MKKLLLLTLIVLSCLAFASCDIVNQFVPGLDLGGIGNKADITEEEWLEAIAQSVPAKFLELNKTAFLLGRNA